MPQEEMDVEEEDDDFEALMDSSSAVEGVRLNPDLYEAYTPVWNPTVGSTIPRRPQSNNATSLASNAPPEGNTDNAPISAPTANRAPHWAIPPPPSLQSLQRQPSIRRPTRSRTVDFNDFTSRRRSTIRQNAAQEGGSSRSEEINDDSGVTLLLPHDEEIPVVQLPNEPASTSRNLPTRRLFPMIRSRPRREGENETPLSPLPDPSWLEEAADSWFALPTPISSSPSQDVDSSEEQSLVPPSAPRLRRGGLRAPESMLMRASPLVAPLITSRIEIENVSHSPPSPRFPLRFEATASQSHESATSDQGSSTHERHTEVNNGVILTESSAVASPL
jgi:hypothetical protein